MTRVPAEIPDDSNHRLAELGQILARGLARLAAAHEPKKYELEQQFTENFAGLLGGGERQFPPRESNVD